MEAEKEELSEEIAALQQERDEGLLLAESEKQQVWGLGGRRSGVWAAAVALPALPRSPPHTHTSAAGAQEPSVPPGPRFSPRQRERVWERERSSTRALTGDTGKLSPILLSLLVRLETPLG